MKNKESNWFVYIISCSDGSLYTGVTTNLQRRIKEHNSGNGAKYTQSRTPVEMVWSEKAENRSEAQKRESKIKSMRRENKIKLING